MQDWLSGADLSAQSQCVIWVLLHAFLLLPTHNSTELPFQLTRRLRPLLPGEPCFWLCHTFKCDLKLNALCLEVGCKWSCCSCIGVPVSCKETSEKTGTELGKDHMMFKLELCIYIFQMNNVIIKLGPLSGLLLFQVGKALTNAKIVHLQFSLDPQ